MTDAPSTGDPVTDILAFTVVTAISMGVSLVGVRWLDRKLREHYQEGCCERSR